MNQKSIKITNTLCFLILNWNVCTKPGKWAVMYMSVKVINFAHFYKSSIGFWNWSENVLYAYPFLILSYIFVAYWCQITTVRCLYYYRVKVDLLISKCTFFSVKLKMK